jgi:succinate-acetate transporter protein
VEFRTHFCTMVVPPASESGRDHFHDDVTYVARMLMRWRIFRLLLSLCSLSIAAESVWSKQPAVALLFLG